MPEYLQAEKFTGEKLKTMLFSTVVDPHWFQKGNNFWFEYKTSEGTFWYVVDPSAQTKNVPSIWQGDHNRFFLTRNSRDLYRIDVCSYAIGQDSIVPLIEERMNTYQETRPLTVLNGGKELIQWSERDGWAHLYLYDDQGKLKNRITQGPWHVECVLKVDEANRTVYFIANGKEKDENPYYQHLYKANLNGSGLKRITKGNLFHQVQVDDEARFIVDNFSRVNTIPCADLLDHNGNKIMTIQESDFSQLIAAGYRFSEHLKGQKESSVDIPKR